jgi:drug/metabolite transporter (DMT)-like permease
MTDRPPATPAANWSDRSQLLATLAPVVFVVLWSTGFVAARYATQDNGPLAFLTVRLAIAGVGLALAARLSGASWPGAVGLRTSAWAGLGLHAAYLGGVFVAIDLGMSPALSALIAGLHPVVTSLVAARWFGEHLAPRQWAGVGLGLAGVALFTGDRLAGTEAALPVAALAAMAVSLAGIVIGTLVQRRRNAQVALLPGTAVQYLASAGLLGVLAVTVERQPLAVTPTFVLAQLWAIGVLSVGAVLLMLWLLRSRAAATVSSLFFLTPSLSALEAWLLFGDTLNAVTVVALAVSAVGVLLVVRPVRPPVTAGTGTSR